MFSFIKIGYRYIFTELVPSFLMGMLVFVGIILMFQGLRLAEFALIHGFGVKLLSEILTYMTISILPALLPMSLLFCVLMTYSRLGNDSELVAFKAAGYSPLQIISPSILFGILVSLLSAQLTFETAPWGNRRFEVIVSTLTNTKAGIALKEGTFMEGFFDMVVYANKVNTDRGTLEHIFIYDERQFPPLTIIAKKGLMVQKNEITGNEVKLTLLNGNVHRKTNTHTKVEFNKFFISLSENYNLQAKDKTLASMNLSELKTEKANINLDPKLKKKYEIEYYKRWCLTLLPLILTLIGATIGLNTQHRGSKGSGFVSCVGLIVIYWILFVVAESSAQNINVVNPAFVIWFPNLLFISASIYLFLKKLK